MKVNDTYFNLDAYSAPEWRQYVMCQEVGHVFGLGHQDENFGNLNLGTCTDYTSSPESNQRPNQHDYDELALKYAHLDDEDSWAPAPVDDGGSGGGKGKNGKNKRGSDEWGRAVASDAGGRPNLFELDLGNGTRVLTRVIWAG